MRRSVLLGVLAACAPGEPAPGTAVGNPGSSVTARIEAAPEVALVGLSWEVARVTALGCDGASAEAELLSTTWRFDQAIVALWPGGAWCGAEVAPAGPLAATVDGEAGSFELPALTLTAAEGPLPSGPLTLVLGDAGWLSAGSTWSEAASAAYLAASARIEADGVPVAAVEGASPESAADAPQGAAPGDHAAADPCAEGPGRSPNGPPGPECNPGRRD